VLVPILALRSMALHPFADLGFVSNH
jgi:hypothetical protein